MEQLNGKKILVFGGSGSLGRALIRRLAGNNTMRVYSRDEAKHWTIRNEERNPNLTFAVGDIRDRQRVEEVILQFRPNIIIIASALKQVDTCELSPQESIKTNISGIENVVEAAEKNLHILGETLETVLLVSTDKACAPVNVYGMCKAISERVVTSRANHHTSPKFIAVRYGNVLESRGSIIPLFRYQADHADAFTVTHPAMTRFLMTLDDSIDLIVTAIVRSVSGELWIPKLKAMKIMDLAEIFSERYGKPVKIIGMRPGEKLHESLIGESESVRVRDIGTHYVVSPAYVEVPIDVNIFEYASGQDVVSKEELATYLHEIGILDMPLSAFVGTRIEEIRTV